MQSTTLFRSFAGLRRIFMAAACGLLLAVAAAAQSEDGGRIEIPAGQITCACSSGGNKLYELKSYIKSSLSGIPTGLLNQFKAYLNNNNVTNMSRLEYIFDKRKLLKNEFENLPNFNPANYFDDVAQAEQAIKGQFQVMMQQNAGDIFQFLGQAKFQQIFGVNNVQDFLSDIVPNLNGPNSIYSFIKVE